MSEWFDETLHSGYRQRLEIDRVLFRDRSEHQDVIIFENSRFGRVLALDGVVQTTQADEFIYHEMLAHPPILAHGAAREVLIVGGGDGGALREVLRHDSVARATMVEIDRSVVDFCREYFPGHSAGAFNDPRTELIIADGLQYAAETERRFDVVIVDSTDPIGPGEVLFTEAFYRDCLRCLNPGGILITQSGVPFVQGKEVTDGHKRLSDAGFADVWFYLIGVPTYNGGPMALGWASDDPAKRRVDAATLVARFHAVGLQTRYYDPTVHQAAFALPPYIRGLFDG